MKNEILLRWLLMPAKWRWLSLTGLLAGVVLLASYGWIAPAHGERQRLRDNTQQQLLRYQRLLAPLLRQPALQKLQLRNQQMLDDMVREGQPFSLYTLLQRSGGELEQWHPDRRDSQLKLWLDWSQLKQLFAYLVICEPAPALTSFVVQRKAERLHATFHLAFDDEIPLD
ncbi:hypothetical protein COO59_10395 [Mixta theicola]|uniref:DNA utilization protein HofO C-terminal domain-containing protein n=1 Tax=Mixta theicola TaxID=1458355 RepID=A0A2K1QA27_9GAMM|nr:hypothetical protein [Mixta theicola]PNS11886.1 hypothetical protein COO59_10395 [Mixta theicola]GLR07817.1 hypothetical protein GCM10007905_05360 [Mixta theicola]